MYIALILCVFTFEINAKQSSKRHMLLYFPETFSDKPRIKIPVQVVRTVPGHILWCLSEGTPPIDMSLLQDFKQGTWIAAAKVMNDMEEENVTCLATNNAGTVSKAFPVTLKGL